MGPSNRVSCETGSFSSCHNPHRFLHSEVLRLQFHEPEPWVVQSVLLPSCSSQFILTQMWDPPVHNPPAHMVHQLQPCRESSLPGCLSLSLLPVWMNVSSLTPWLSDFHTVRFSVSSGCFFVFKFGVVPLSEKQKNVFPLNLCESDV